MGGPWSDWTTVVAVLAALLVLDLAVLHRRGPRVISIRRALVLSVIWVAIAFAYAVVVWAERGGGAASEYVTGYLLERSLSIDNVFVFALLFGMFGIPAELQMRVLVWGVVMAIVMRGAFIAGGAALLSAAHWVLYLFGAFLVLTAVKLLRHSEVVVHPERNPVLRLVGRAVPSTARFHGDRVFVRVDGRRLATPLLGALVAIGTTDLAFALDSIPAIFGVTRDAYVVFASNAFAVLGLVPLYFLLAGSMARFGRLNVGLALVLGFVGVKMLVAEVVPIPIWLSLLVIVGVLAGSIVASILWPPRRPPPGAPAAAPAADQALRSG